jgi:hypothetical protein
MVKRWVIALMVASCLMGHGLGQTNSSTQLPKALADANAGVKLGIPQGARVLLRDIVVFSDGVLDPSLRAFVEPLLKNALTEAGLTIVATPQEVRREVEERQWERASDEIHKGSLPPKGTILRESVELKVTVHLVRSAKEWAALLGELRRRRINIGGFLIRNKETGAVLFAEFVDNATQTTTAQLVSFASDKDQTFALTGTPFGAIMLSRDNQRQRDLNALRAAMGYLSRLLKVKMTERDPLKGKVLGKVAGITTNFVAINLGRLDGVREGMRFAVHPVRNVGGERVTLPACAQLRVLVVNDTNAVCDVVDGSLDAISEGDEVREVVGENRPTR